MKNYKLIFSFIIVLISLYSCQQDNYVFDGDDTDVTDPENTELSGFYVLNEGNYGTNSASLDFMDLENGVYKSDIYATANPTIVKELGDTGNDVKIYGSKMYAIINGSNIIEVMNAKTAKHLATISLDNGRYIKFANGKAYATSYAPISTDISSSNGKVVEIDTLTLAITRELEVGRQPDGLEIVGNELFVANSGGYTTTNDYENTVSVIDLSSFVETSKIEVGINLNQIEKDSDNDLYISSRGNYSDVSSNLYVIDSQSHQVKKTFNLPISNFTIDNNQLYYYSYSYVTSSATYGLINTKTETVTSSDFITDSNVKDIVSPYSISVNPISKDIYITDAGNYTSSGYLYSFDKNGVYKTKVATGIIPGHIAFLYK
ncbi:YncE family protein [Chishuiella sp.]|uniref:YncE family protein n=1 Tax=Chishuiella sp. TaxID=1969467 RepID=UPI0028AFCDE2|nr:DUF5074 domain-containing protein [Chishuiella sp.]